MKVMFTVQGEGRGHMTQAIAMQEMLQRHGHRVAAVLVGSNQNRSLPAFFEEAFAGRVQSIASPGFAVANGRGISLVRTATNAYANAPTFSRSLRTIHETVTAVQPDLIVNFLEPLLGVYNTIRRHRVPVLAVGHQFMLDHPAFVQDRKWSLDRLGMGAYVALTGARSARLALSFYRADDLPSRRLFVCPPILRRQVFEQPPTRSTDTCSSTCSTTATPTTSCAGTASILRCRFTVSTTSPALRTKNGSTRISRSTSSTARNSCASWRRREASRAPPASNR